MKVDRIKLLAELEAVGPGLAAKEQIEQSTHFILPGGGKVCTFNDEVCCRGATMLDVEGTVPSKPLLEMLRKLPEDEVEMSASDGVLVVKGKGRRTKIRMDAEVTLPVDSVELPEEWQPLPDGFLDAVDVVRHCVGRDESHFSLTCIHLHPEWLEACDNIRLIRYPMKTGVAEPCLVKGESLRHVVGLGAVEQGETESWAHFRNASGVTMSCRRHLERYPDTSKKLKFKEAVEVVLPKGLTDAVDRAEVFSGEDPDDNEVIVVLQPGRMALHGRGPSGRYSEVKRVEYDGEPLSFSMAPKMLVEIAKRADRCELVEGRVRVKGPGFVYVSRTGVVEEE